MHGRQRLHEADTNTRASDQAESGCSDLHRCNNNHSIPIWSRRNRIDTSEIISTSDMLKSACPRECARLPPRLLATSTNHHLVKLKRRTTDLFADQIKRLIIGAYKLTDSIITQR
jgi:hypothetical protein